MLLLAYVDDLMIACKDREAALNLVERLGRSVKIKVTGILSKDKKIDFLGRVKEIDTVDVLRCVVWSLLRMVASAKGCFVLFYNRQQREQKYFPSLFAKAWKRVFCLG